MIKIFLSGHAYHNSEISIADRKVIPIRILNEGNNKSMRIVKL